METLIFMWCPAQLVLLGSGNGSWLRGHDENVQWAVCWLLKYYWCCQVVSCLSSLWLPIKGSGTPAASALLVSAAPLRCMMAIMRPHGWCWVKESIRVLMMFLADRYYMGKRHTVPAIVDCLVFHGQGNELSEQHMKVNWCKPWHALFMAWPLQTYGAIITSQQIRWKRQCMCWTPWSRKQHPGKL